LCNPGQAALSAVSQYQETEALYFVADGEGGHWFADSLREHNENVRRYRNKMRGR
ncbi:MAG TPA: 4-amino-4-deoxychorismate lyase, partial [Alphaproteobacteria bacterium]|nr:4-amino-4-deoxychorismate lyase [Alphaproteobacteria bacterium]